jgi:hypothetical protein
MYDEKDEHGKGKHTVQQIADEFGVTRPNCLPPLRQGLWVPNRSSRSCGLGIFMYQPTESVAASEVQVGL